MCHVGDVRRRSDHRMNQPALGVDPEVRLHSEVPLVALLRLLPLRIAGLRFVLHRRRRGNDRRIGDRPLRHRQPGRAQRRQLLCIKTELGKLVRQE